MQILCCVIARQVTVLAKYATCTGNFMEITQHILQKIGREDTKMTYTQGNYLFHYVVDSGVTYLCITDDDFDRAQAFSFLVDIQKRFERTYHNRTQTALPYAMQSEFSRTLAAEMTKHGNTFLSPTEEEYKATVKPVYNGQLRERRFSDPLAGKQADNMTKVESELDELKGIMVKNIESVMQRGERLELLVDKTDDLNATSLTFKKSSRNLATAMWWKNAKLIVAIVVIVLILLLIILFSVCGFDFSQCSK